MWEVLLQTGILALLGVLVMMTVSEVSGSGFVTIAVLLGGALFLSTGRIVFGVAFIIGPTLFVSYYGQKLYRRVNMFDEPQRSWLWEIVEDAEDDGMLRALMHLSAVDFRETVIMSESKIEMRTELYDRYNDAT